MDSLYARSEETVAKRLLSSVPLDRLVIALAEVTREVLSSADIPVSLRPRLLLRALRLLQAIEHEQGLLDLCFVRYVPHPECGEGWGSLGELWALPREHEWLCDRCGRPLYDIESTKM